MVAKDIQQLIRGETIRVGADSVVIKGKSRKFYYFDKLLCETDERNKQFVINNNFAQSIECAKRLRLYRQYLMANGYTYGIVNKSIDYEDCW